MRMFNRVVHANLTSHIGVLRIGGAFLNSDYKAAIKFFDSLIGTNTSRDSSVWRVQACLPLLGNAFNLSMAGWHRW
jgi:hypothetical protein